MNIISATNKINFGYYEKLFRHFGFGDDHLLKEAISANIYSPNKFKNNDELETALWEEWNQIPRNIYMNLIESMPRRIEAVISNNGWPTRYWLYIQTSKISGVVIMCVFKQLFFFGDNKNFGDHFKKHFWTNFLFFLTIILLDIIKIWKFAYIFLRRLATFWYKLFIFLLCTFLCN